MDIKEQESIVQEEVGRGIEVVSVQPTAIVDHVMNKRRRHDRQNDGSAQLRDGSEHWTRSIALKLQLQSYEIVLHGLEEVQKVALVDSGVRMKEPDKTAFIFRPGGLGTMDELFEIPCLMQLKKLGTRFPVPLVLCNFPSSSNSGDHSGNGGSLPGGGFYDGLLEFTARCVEMQTVGLPELKDVLIAVDENEVLEALTEFYSIEMESAPGVDGSCVDGVKVGKKKLARASDWVEAKIGLSV